MCLIPKYNQWDDKRDEREAENQPLSFARQRTASAVCHGAAHGTTENTLLSSKFCLHYSIYIDVVTAHGKANPQPAVIMVASFVTLFCRVLGKAHGKEICRVPGSQQSHRLRRRVLPRAARGKGFTLCFWHLPCCASGTPRTTQFW